MSRVQRIALVFAVMLLGVVVLSQVATLHSESGALLGIMYRDIYDDALFVAAALWGLGAGMTSSRAARSFLLIFGTAYLVDGGLGLATGFGFLDLGVFTHTSLGPSFALDRLLPNALHLGLGTTALAAGLWPRPRK